MIPHIFSSPNPATLVIAGGWAAVSLALAVYAVIGSATAWQPWILAAAAALVSMITLTLFELRRNHRLASQLADSERGRKRLIEVIHDVEQELTEARVLNENLAVRNAELERFAQAVSHDIRSPLTTIRGFARLLVDDVQGGDSRRIDKDVRYLLKASDEIGTLLEKLPPRPFKRLAKEGSVVPFDRSAA